MAGLFNRRRRSDSYQGFNKYANEINAYHNPTQQYGLPVPQQQNQYRTASMTSAGQAAAAALRMHSSPVKQQQQLQPRQQSRQPLAQHQYTPRANSLSTGRSNSMRLYTYNPKPSYTVGNGNARSYSLSSRHSYNGRPGVTSPLQHEYIDEEDAGAEEVITTKTTRVVDSSGRTTSITTKTIRTLPDGSNIIETTTKNISRPTSRLNSLSSGNNVIRGNTAADVNLTKIEEDFDKFEYDYQVDNSSLDNPDTKLKLNLPDNTTSTSPKQLGAAFASPQQRSDSLNSQGQPKSILKNSGHSIKRDLLELGIPNGKSHQHHESPPSSIRFNPTVQTREFNSPKTNVVKKKKSLTEEEMLAAAYKAANKKVYGEHADAFVVPPEPKKSKKSKKEKKSEREDENQEHDHAHEHENGHEYEKKHQSVLQTPSSPVLDVPGDYTYENHHRQFALHSMRDEMQRSDSTWKERVKEKREQMAYEKARAKEEKKLAKETAEEEKRLAKETAEEEKRLAKEAAEEEKRLAKEAAEEEKRRRKETADEEKKGKRGFLNKFIVRRRSSASSNSNRSSDIPVAFGNEQSSVVGTIEETLPLHIPTTNQVQAPVVQTPVVQSPVVQAPVVQAPVAQAPVVQAPVVQAPVIQSPVIQAPVVQSPLVKSVGNPSANGNITASHVSHNGFVAHHDASVDPLNNSVTNSGATLTQAANTNIPLNSPIYYSGSEEKLNSQQPSSDTPVKPHPESTITEPAVIHSPLDTRDNNVVKVAVPISKSEALPEPNVAVPIPEPEDHPQPNVDIDPPTDEPVESQTEDITHVPHVPVPHLVEVGDEDVDDAEADDYDDEPGAIDVIDDYRRSTAEPEDTIHHPAEPLVNGHGKANEADAPINEIPPPNLHAPSPDSTGNTPQITAVPVFAPASIPEHKIEKQQEKKVDSLPETNSVHATGAPIPTNDTDTVAQEAEELIVEKKEKSSKRQRFLKFFVL